MNQRRGGKHKHFGSRSLERRGIPPSAAVAKGVLARMRESPDSASARRFEKRNAPATAKVTGALKNLTGRYFATTRTISNTLLE